MKDKKAQAGMVVGMAIMAIITIVILGVIYTFVQTNSLTRTTVENESVVISGHEGQLANTRFYSLSFFGNNSASVVTTGAAVNVSSTGEVNVSNVTFVDATYNATYIHTPSGYITDSSTRNLIGLISVLLAIVILVTLLGTISLKT